MQDCHWTRVGTMSRRMVPWMEKFRWVGRVEEEKSTARRWLMRAPRSWPRRIKGIGELEEGRREDRVARREFPVLRLSWGPGRGADRP
jgi:hypothetical protein